MFIGFFIVDFIPVENILLNRFLYLTTFCLGSMLPDIIEPGYSIKHRRFFHSKVLLFILIMCEIYLVGYEEYLIFVLILGYIFHLLLDSTTRRSLPLI